MALPQTIDQSTLNLTGKPAMATPPTTITSAGGTGMAAPKIENVKNEVSPLLGGLFGGLLGYAAQNRGTTTAGANQQGANQQQAGAPNVSGIANSILNALKGTTGTASGKPIGGGSTGTVSGMAFPPGTTQTEIDLQLGKTNGVSNYILAGTNMSNGTVIAQPNTSIPGYTSTGTGSGPSDTATPPNNQDAGTYFQDSYGNIYDPNGNLYAVNSGGTYYVASDNGMWTNVNTGDQLTSDQFYGGGASDGYTGGGYDPNTDYTDITDGGSYADGSIFDNSPIDTGTYVKDGGYIGSGLPTPLFKRGGNIKHFATGGDSIIDAATAMAPSTALSSTSPTSTQNTVDAAGNTIYADNTGGGGYDPNTSAGSIASLVSNLLSNKALTGAGLGALLTQLINSGTSHPTNKGVDMTALGTLKSRTTPAGATRFVPYSEYGTPTTPYDYSTLYQNLGVSPFGSGAVSPSTPTSAAPTPTIPTTTGGLSTLATPTTTPTTTTPTTTTTSAPMYYSDADGNIYDANGDLVYDTTSSSVVTPTTSSTASSSLAVPSVASTPAVTSPTYSYGTPVSPSEILSSKKGGLAVKKMADGGMSDLAVSSLDYTPYYDKFISSYDPSGNTTRQSIIDTIHKLNPYMLDSDIDNMVASDPYHAQALLGSDAYLTYGVGSEKGNYYDGLDHPNYTGISTGIPSEIYTQGVDVAPPPTFTPEVLADLKERYGNTIFGNDIPLPYERTDVSTTSTGTDFPPMMYNQGMPKQGNLMPSQNQTAMPTQGPAMPQQTPFSASPTFRFSGANNPLLTGLRQQVSGQQPYMLMPNGTFAPREEISTSRGYSLGGQPITDNLNVPVSTKPFSNVPSIQGRGDYRTGAYVEGAGDGQSDDIPAMLADGEYVIDAETVAQLGNGSNKAGAKVLDDFRKNIRAHKRSASHDKIPPKSKSPLAYLKGAK